MPSLAAPSFLARATGSPSSGSRVYECNAFAGGRSASCRSVFLNYQSLFAAKISLF